MGKELKRYWKNIIWNYTIRYIKLFSYYQNKSHKSKWKHYYYPYKKYESKKQEDLFFGKALEIFRITLADIKSNSEKQHEQKT